jgi:hypothetical protein
MLLFMPLMSTDALQTTGSSLVYVLRASLPAARNMPLAVAQGDTFTLAFPVLLPSGIGVDYASPTYSFALSSAPYAIYGAAPVAAKTGALQQILGVWTALVSFARVDTASLSAGAHYYELLVVDGVNEDVVSTGSLNLGATIIRP